MVQRKLPLLLGSLAAIAVGVAVVRAQDPEDLPVSIPKPTIGADELVFRTNVGSFKLLGSDEAPPTGKLTFAFDGTVLVTDPQGTLTVSPGVRKEYENDVHKKIAYHGKGTLTLDGKVRSVQFFGKSVDGRFKGNGLFRFYGEFDKNLDTGSYQFVGGKPNPWGTGGGQVPVPQQIFAGGAGTPEPTVKDE